jgi:NADH pyrophosphatase NudC (nudix superfamily)
MKIRPVALLAAIKNNKILVIDGHNYNKHEDFYRLIGGGIEFGETGAEALKREVKEEINVEIKNVKYLGLIENVFNYEGKDMHEIILLYKADFKDKNIYKRKEIEIADSRHPQKAYWLDKKLV